MSDATPSEAAVPGVIYHSANEASTEEVAQNLASQLRPGSFVALVVPLGAGKSVFARAVGRYWGVAGPMPSPTYTLMAVYNARCPIYHMDLYRLGSADELNFAGLASYLSADGISLIEWADKIRDSWPNSGWIVTLTPGDQDLRRITVERFGSNSPVTS